MPPRKKPRLETSTAATPIPSSAPASASADSPSTSTYASAPEPATPTAPTSTSSSIHWTTNLLSTLFKSVIHAKPTGPHKHMHMLAVQRQLASATGHHVPVRETWRVLEELYDLRVLDEREAGFVWGRCDDRGEWSDSLGAEMRLPGVPAAHGVDGSEEEDEEEDEDGAGAGAGVLATERLWRPRDQDEAWFMEEVWKRRFKKEESDVVEEGRDVKEEGTEADSPAPSTAASATRRTRATRQTRASERRSSKASTSATPAAEEEGGEIGDSEEDGDEEQDGDAEDAAKPKRNMRRSARSAPAGKRGRKK